MKTLSNVRCFGGQQIQASHDSKSCACEMTFSIFLPPQSDSSPPPILYWLSGLTCTDQNFVTKAGAQQFASRYGIAVVCPDTSPRGDGVADDSDGAYDLGLGAGFYVNATQAPWAEHYQMYDYITQELPALVAAEFPVDTERTAISGHSMGGHGALTIALKNPDRFRSASAFSPIVAPTQVPWGHKAFSAYLGDDTSLWAAHDAVELIQAEASKLPILIDQGEADNFLAEQLKTELMVNAAEQAKADVQVRMQPGYDHSYFFIASFIESHFEFHAQHLKS